MTADPESDPTAGMTAAAAAAAARMTKVVVATDDDDEKLDRVRRAATALAKAHGWDLVLYDRSQERWTDTPHPSGPVRVDELDGSDREHLVRQMRDIEAAGVNVTAWLATVPALTAMIDVLQELEVDGVFLPVELDKPKIMDRLLEGDDVPSMVERVADLQLERAPSFLTIDDDDVIELVEYPGP